MQNMNMPLIVIFSLLLRAHHESKVLSLMLTCRYIILIVRLKRLGVAMSSDMSTKRSSCGADREAKYWSIRSHRDDAN